MNVSELYNYLLLENNRDLVGGFIRPQDFNLLLQSANHNYFVKAYARYQSSQRITDDLRPLMEEEFIISADGKFNLPEDYKHADTVSTAVITSGDECGVAPSVSRQSVTVVTNDEFTAMMSDYLTKASLKNPIGTIRSGYIEVEPLAINRIRLWYLRKPKTPFFDYKLDVSGNIIYLPEGDLHDGTVLADTTPSRTSQFEYGGGAIESIKEDLLILSGKRARDGFMIQTTENNI